MELLEFIRSCELFEGLPDAQMRKLSAIARELEFERAENIFAEGEEADGFYIVKSGKIKIYKLSRDGREQIMHVFGPGEMFGEAAAFTGGSYPASAVALEKSRTIFMPKAAFMRLISEEPSAALNMLAALSRRLRQLANLVESLSLKEVPGRLAAHVLRLSEQSGGNYEVDLDIPKSQIASLLGTIPETLSRILGRMASEGLISVAGRNIRILDRAALSELAAGERKLQERSSPDRRLGS